ncbi:MAG: DUF192 domain-containing protein [Phycisphaerae bacterium]
MPRHAQSRLACRRSSLFPTAAVLLLALSACTAGTSTGTSTEPSPPNDMHFDTVAATIKGKPFTLEIADTEPKRERGLMFRNSVAADHGMIFLFDAPDNYRFWMKNTYIPLDIIFVDAGGKVIDIEPREARDETSMGPDAPASYVIELNAGTAKNIGLSRGDHIDIPEKLLKRTVHSDEK